MDWTGNLSKRRSRESGSGSGISAKTSLFTFDYVRKKKSKSITSSPRQGTADNHRKVSTTTTTTATRVPTDSVLKKKSTPSTKAKAASSYKRSEKEEENSVPETKTKYSTRRANSPKLNGPVRKKSKTSTKASESYGSGEEENFECETNSPGSSVATATYGRIALKELTVNLERIDAHKRTGCKISRREKRRSTPISTPVPVSQPDIQEFIIEQKQSEYLTLSNSGDNRLAIPSDYTLSTASYMNPDMCEGFETLYGEGDSLKMSIGRVGHGMRCGYFKIKARSVVPPDTVDDVSVTFWLIEGNLTVKSCGGYMTYNNGMKVLYPQQLTRGASIHIPPKTCYTFENWGETDVLLGYTAIKCS